MTAPRFQFSVLGTPAGQGNLSGTRHGKLRHANGDELKVWRGKVRQAAVLHIGVHERQPFGKQACVLCDQPAKVHAAMLGPVRLEAVVTVERPKTVTARWPITRGSSDWDHYARALGDALTGVAYVDDSQVIDGRAIVTYPNVHPDALAEPGAVIKIWPIEGVL
ncbi:RusA family crossover junction endodeoxyribonuclease [Nonomuraea angiospora]|uniref:RusA family crossover junction endodeoxyribonuclease n=1 Tax=Nonomuraea angiospora TaxID=46172 RepID=UPI0029A4CEE5|nr:RusA family crossover junction endodeoxyribonuclease [Nonomuraea angiospora]MDX3109693.1 RusA family crossover junction endodeoxyribonuclease [Nonomuraea angiospora]